MRCSVGIFAYNEEKNIEKVITAILNQELSDVEICEVIIIASGCTDDTVLIARKLAERDSRIKVISGSKREGKAEAINVFLREARSELLVMESGDTVPEKNAVEKLIAPFVDNSVGMTGARPVPVDDPKTLMGYTAHLLWNLHHQISLKNPKMGEMVAFRKVFESIPQTAVDEAFIEQIVTKKGYKIAYVPEAVVYNKGPENVSDFIRQRRRIHCGHLNLKKETGYKVSTGDPLKLIYLVAKQARPNFIFLFFTPISIFLEALSVFLGWFDFEVLKKKYIIWDIAQTTKKLKQ